MTFYLYLGRKKGASIKGPIFKPLKTIGPKGELPKFPKSTTGLFMDPGARNFAICIIKNGKVVGTHMLQNPVKEIKNKTFHTTINSFLEEIEKILYIIKPNVIVGERFVVRGFGANSSELIGQMLGIILKYCKDDYTHIHYVMAGQWKRKTTPIFDLKELYKHAKKEFKLAPHQVDSMLIGRYTLNGNTFTNNDLQWIEENLPRCCKGIIDARAYSST